MKGIYKTKDGLGVEILEFDGANKIAYAKFKNGETKWVAEQEYSTWSIVEPEIKALEPIAEEPVIEEEVKVAKKPIVKKAAKEVAPKPKTTKKKSK